MNQVILARLRDFLLILLSASATLVAIILTVARIWLAPLLLQAGLGPATAVGTAVAFWAAAVGAGLAYVFTSPPACRTATEGRIKDA